MNKTVSIIVTLGLVVGIAIIFMGGNLNSGNEIDGNSGQNIEVRNGIQYITINAGGGYAPRVSSAKAGIPTKLIMKTKGLYDCSASLVIRSINYQNILPQTGDTEIDIGIPKAGVPLQGVCGMGMYSFLINFS